VLGQVLPLLWCNRQDQVFRPIACNQEILLSDDSQTNERELAGVGRLPQPVERYIGNPVSLINKRFP